MSLYGSLYSGVSGLISQSSKVAVIADNISNVNTVGYKGGLAQFRTLVTASVSTGAYSPGGVLASTRQLVSRQGLLQATNSPTDVAISGKGLFIVNSLSDSSGQVFYTRAGSFRQDATGNFVNSAGFFLQAWPLDREGRLPGEPGNQDTTSSASLSSLRTVNVQNVTGAAAATSTVSIGANLRASETIFPGAAGVITMNALDTANRSNTASSIIVPQPTGTLDRLTRGDEMTIGTGANPGGFTFVYGGFTFGRTITSASATDGDSGVARPVNNTTLTQAAADTPNNPFEILTTTAGSSDIRITTSAAHGLAVGDVVTLANLTAFNGLTAPQLNSTFVITNVSDSTHFDVETTGTATGTGVTTNADATATYQPRSFKVTDGSPDVTIRQVAHGFVDDQVVRISGVTSSLAGIPASDFDGTFRITVVDANHYTITVATDATVAGGGSTGGDSGTVVADARPFSNSGNILDATIANQSFLGTTGTAIFKAAALSFTITVGGAAHTFTYTSTTPRTSEGEFNNMTNLSTAISSVPGLTARVSGGKLYISAIDASQAISFANGSIEGEDGATPGTAKYGIDWISELGLANVAQETSGNLRFSTLQGLADQVNNNTDGLTASIENPLTDSILTVNVDDPLDTIVFTDGSTMVNTGSLVAALAINEHPSLGGAAFTSQTTGTLGPAYDPTDSDKSMAGGAITAQFGKPVRIFDSLGTGHDLNVNFIKIAANTWAVEIFATDPTEVTTLDGQLASGTIVFNGDGSLRSVTGTIATAVDIAWTNGAVSSSVNFDWGTAGQPFGTAGATTIGRADGLSQFDSAYRVSFVNQNGAPVGDLNGVTIDEDGFVTVSYSNGETQRLFRIPLADFANPDQLQSESGNVFSQSSSSGEVNLTPTGTAGVGKIAASSLEASNVELANELTDMIVAQRAYQANTKVISTADTLLSDLNQILR